MSDDVVKQLPSVLAAVFDAPVEVVRATQLAGGASKEAWAVDAHVGGETLELIVRRAGGGLMYSGTLTLAEELEVLRAAWEAGVPAPRPYGYIPDLAGREAFVMERLEGETIGRRLVTRPDLDAARASLPAHMADALARIHSVPRQPLGFLFDPGPEPARGSIARWYGELDALEDPHPAIELGLLWLRTHLPPPGDRVVLHGDFRIGNLMVDARGLVGVLDWEFAQAGDPAEDLAWPLVRAWRFGVDAKRLGGIGDVEPYLERYNAQTGRDISLDALRWWELLGNVKWAICSFAQARRHLKGEERSVELAVLGRLASEVELEIVSLVEQAGGL